MTLEVLLSAMHLEDYHYIESLNITGNCVVVNQCDRNSRQVVEEKARQITYIETIERGLSKSRNMAIENAKADICIFCDNDVEYQEDYEQLILNEHKHHPEFDIIVFHVESSIHPVPCYSSPRRIHFLTSGRLHSVEITFKRDRLQGIRLNERIGAGTKYRMGEENAFLYECLRQGLKIYYVPKKIARLRDEPSTWNQGFDQKFFISRGASFDAMSSRISLLLVVQYALRKYHLYKNQVTFFQALQYMLAGRNSYRKEGMDTKIKLFIAGDYWSGTGPANVTKSLIQGKAHPFLYQKTRNKFLRILEIIVKTICADAAVYSAFSAQNLWGFAIAKFFHRPSFYLMHGSIRYEDLLNQETNPVMVRQEAAMLKSADYILAVSLPFERWLKQHYPKYSHKIYTLTNGIDWNKLKNSWQKEKKVPGQILSVGGGMPRKNILSLCKAIEQIYQEEPNCMLKLIVLGAEGKDSAALRKYPFVEDRGLVSHKETLACMAESTLFIQNSSFETFGLAPVEALLQGCSLLISSNVGAVSVMTTVQENDVIEHPKNPEELTSKIRFALKNPNAERLLQGIDRELTSVEYRQKELLTLVKQLGMK